MVELIRKTAERLSSIYGNVDQSGNISVIYLLVVSSYQQTSVNRPAFLKQNIMRKLLNTNGIYYN